MRRWSLLITCEHGGNRVPARWRGLFAGRQHLLNSHRGFDAGALALARSFAARLRAPLLYSRTTRLLIDLNRSPGHRQLYSEITRQLPAAQRSRILEQHYLPYRCAVERQVEQVISGGGRVLHLSVHSFTPVLDGEVRKADLGLLYDPRRRAERVLATHWRRSFADLCPGLRVRMNYPYTGRADGLVSFLRRRFPGSRYLGIELELNQRHVSERGRHWASLRRDLPESLLQALDTMPVASGR